MATEELKTKEQENVLPVTNLKKSSVAKSGNKKKNASVDKKSSDTKASSSIKKKSAGTSPVKKAKPKPAAKKAIVKKPGKATVAETKENKEVVVKKEIKPKAAAKTPKLMKKVSLIVRSI